ncbi:MAG: hypothetical protein JRN15_16065 [Nitrososphaerota archaeon]|nr:hypothetical protein [Nitrososphaerota archaeon]
MATFFVLLFVALLFFFFVFVFKDGVFKSDFVCLQTTAAGNFDACPCFAMLALFAVTLVVIHSYHIALMCLESFSA